MPPYTGEGTYQIIFYEQRKYEVRVKAPSREAAQKWALRPDLFHRCASHVLGRILRDKYDKDFECQDVIKTIAAEEDTFDLAIDETGKEIHGKTR